MIRYILGIIVVVVLIIVGNYQQDNPTRRYGDDHRPGEILSVPGFHAKTKSERQVTKSGKPPIRPVKPVPKPAETSAAMEETQPQQQAMPTLPAGHVAVEESQNQEIFLLETENPNP